MPCSTSQSLAVPEFLVVFFSCFESSLLKLVFYCYRTLVLDLLPKLSLQEVSSYQKWFALLQHMVMLLLKCMFCVVPFVLGVLRQCFSCSVCLRVEVLMLD